MRRHNLAVVSVLADMGNGEVRDAGRDLPLVSGKDHLGSTAERLLHWDAEWHFDPRGVTFERKVIGGHLILLGLRRAEPMFAEYTYPVIKWAREQGAVVGFAHMQYLSEGIPGELSCCLPLEYPVEVALGTVDFLMEDVWRNEAAIHAYYRLLNCGFRPGIAAGTDFPCNSREAIGSLLTHVSVPGGNLNYRNWIEGIARGRTVISTNAHKEFLDLRVNASAGPGDEVQLDRPGRIPVTVRWTAIEPLSGRVELVWNGRVVESVSDAKSSPGHPLEWSTSVEVPASSWLCARRMDNGESMLHTAAVFLNVRGIPIRTRAEDARFFIEFIDKLIQESGPGGEWNRYFSKDLAAAQDRYRKAREVFRRIAEGSGMRH
jgi:hypothetical protein